MAKLTYSSYAECLDRKKELQTYLIKLSDMLRGVQKSRLDYKLTIGDDETILANDYKFHSVNTICDFIKKQLIEDYKNEIQETMASIDKVNEHINNWEEYFRNPNAEIS